MNCAPAKYGASMRLRTMEFRQTAASQLPWFHLIGSVPGLMRFYVGGGPKILIFSTVRQVSWNKVQACNANFLLANWKRCDRNLSDPIGCVSCFIRLDVGGALKWSMLTSSVVYYRPELWLLEFPGWNSYSFFKGHSSFSLSSHRIFLWNSE
jgi:hypothetical protein